MIVFTDYVPDESVIDSGKNLKTQVGWSLIACLAGNLTFNISLIMREVISNVIDSFKTRRAKAARLEEIELINKRIQDAEKTAQLNAVTPAA
jgi:hypothetical protein